ncbi:macro domain-containing protein, partial [Jatrophihabitans sp.]|uniref:macro domain-containing protein n=1 Tax=Jatrophihabitans sp. TaxID=1932789 RepID=UPI0030C6E863|nr:O-acetyl-ADP-ribose deacetylase [Jatrophihabitans sp.]
TAANETLAGGGGVDRAVHLAAGPELVVASRALAPCAAGGAVITPAFALSPVRWVIHAVGPYYTGLQDGSLLAGAYTASLARADEVGARTIAFPSISTGAYRYPKREAARISVAALRGATTDVEVATLVALETSTYNLWAWELGLRPLL